MLKDKINLLKKLPSRLFNDVTNLLFSKINIKRSN